MGTNVGTEPGIRYDASARVLMKVWTLDNVDTVGDWVAVGAMSDVSIHLYSADWNGGTIKILGTNEEVPAASQANAVVCEDLQGNAMSFTANALEGVGVVPQFICPKVTAGAMLAAGTKVVLFARKQQRG